MGTLKVTNLAKSFGIDELFTDVSFEVARGDKVGFVGANGAGKSTLMKILMGQEEYDAGSIQWDSNDTIGYVEQTADFAGGTLYEEFQHAFDDIRALGAKKAELEQRMNTEGTEGEQGAALLDDYSRVMNRFEILGGYDYESRLRRIAYGLGFTEDDFKKDVQHFSGGQKTRICLAKALMREPDFLFLDEPTNHLDIPAKETIEEALMAYPGTFLAVSHDRYFLDKVANCTLVLENGSITEYNGNYSYYRERVEAEEAEAAEEREEQERLAKIEEKRAKEKERAARKKAGGARADSSAETGASVSRATGSDAAAEQARKDAALRGSIQSMSDTKRQEMIDRAEAEIAMAEAELKGIEYEMNDPAAQSDPAKSQQLADAYAAKQVEIEERYAKWERLTEA